MSDQTQTAQEKVADAASAAQAKATEAQAKVTDAASSAQAAVTDKPEVQAGLAFAGAFLAAKLLKAIGR